VSAVLSPSLPFLRDMQAADLAVVTEVERSAYEFPWTFGIFRDCVHHGYVCRVWEADGVVLGYGIMSVAVQECHLLNICVRPAEQRRGHGERIISALLDIARERGAHVAFLEVRESNEAAHRLYSRLGFNEIGVRPQYYPAHGQREDAIVLAREL
jgi:ribosomal-protein-alanine N-acetyltransferase